MKDNFTALNGIFAIIAAAMTSTLLSWRPRRLRWTAAAVAAVFVGGAMSFDQSVLVSDQKMNDPATATAVLEEQMLTMMPALTVVKEDNGQAWREFTTELGQRVAEGGGQATVADVQWAQAKMGEMIRGVWHNASMADDAAIAALARKELALDEMLQREAVQMCATRGDPMWNLNSLPPQSLRAAQEFMAMVAVAYRQGKGRQVPMASDEIARQLFRQAVFWQDSPLTKEDAAYFFGDDRADAVRRCRVRLQFERNMLAIPESITLLRWHYAHQ